jgi:TIGR03009 family protein
MENSMRRIVMVLAVVCALGGEVWGQAPAVPQQQPQAIPVPPEFVLNPMQQAYLDQVLSAWQTESGKVAIFQCPFERWEFNNAFGPGGGLPLHKNKGELSYQQPDKGSFQIIEVNTWQAKPVPPGGAPPAQAQGDWVLQKDAIGEHWVSDGQNIYEYRANQKQLVVRPIPPALQGKAIQDGPLPFLFGADAAKLKARFRMRAEQQVNNPDEILVQSLPTLPADAADYRQIDVMLDRQRMMPKAMQVHLPNGDRHVYMFEIEKATVNGNLQRIMAYFSAQPAPQAPGALNGRQAAQPEAVPR